MWHNIHMGQGLGRAKSITVQTRRNLLLTWLFGDITSIKLFGNPQWVKKFRQIRSLTTKSTNLPGKWQHSKTQTAPPLVKEVSEQQQQTLSFFYWGLMKNPLLSSAGFVCLHVRYRKVFREEFSRLSIQRPLLF